MSSTLQPDHDDAGVYRTLLESTQAIPWRIDWASARFTYIGPQIERVLGWPQGSWQTVDDWATRIHPEDRQKTVDCCVSQSLEGVDHEADYRALTADGDYVWIRDVVHVIRHADGSVDCLVGFMFDISERKRAEDKILQLQKELEALSYRDALTGVANRRMFDRILDVEWGKARALAQPLSLVIVDIDFFKQYNDRYGHPQGDACLKEVARVLDRAAARTRDLCARLGGEEFALVLPATDEAAALAVARRCAQQLARAALPHAASNVAEVVTCSMGVATIVPGSQDTPGALIDLADARLYRAKAAGRNRIAGSAG
ncbi:sensor domain-containing diguanylate cyclase [Massilia putida]|uniref:sensor domain-containing diguanylate cyclase n=1 Tax=Massilia putida TaxID=1141883 RepID=UPI00095172DC|nr:sensor domain-containing diguanylate cyclase [Massilia putida]